MRNGATHSTRLLKTVSLYEGHILKTPFPTGYFTNIIHGANEPLGHGPEGYYVMVEGTRRLLEWSQKLTIRPYILLLSSGGVARDSAYGRGKAMTELLLERHDLLGKVVRIYTLIGPNTPIRYAIGNFIRQAIDYGAVRVVGGQNIWRSYLHVDDAARAIADAVDNGEVLKPVDIGSRQKISIYDAAKLVAESIRRFLRPGRRGASGGHIPAECRARLSDHFPKTSTGAYT
jgi:nucleoside-diphosphate-sugar epimerase